MRGTLVEMRAPVDRRRVLLQIELVSLPGRLGVQRIHDHNDIGLQMTEMRPIPQVGFART